MKRVLRQARAAGVASLLGLGLFLAGVAEPATANPSPPAWTQIKVGLPGESLGFASWFLAQEGGFFARHRLEVKFVFLSGDAIPAALVTGGIQATPLIETVMQAKLAGYKVRNVAVLVSRPVLELVARGRIRSIQDLKGKTVVAGPPKVMPTILLKYLLQQAGLAPDRDVKIVYVGSIAARRTLLLSDRGDAIIESTKDALQLMEKLPDLHPLIGESQMPRQLADGVGTSLDFLEHNPDLVKRMVRSLAEADAWARSHPEEAAAMLGKYMKMPSSGKRLADVLIRAFADRLTPTPELYDAEAKFLSLSNGVLIRREQVMSAWDTQIAAEVDEERYGTRRSTDH